MLAVAALAGCHSREPAVRAWVLADGTKVYLRAGTTIEPVAGFPHPRALNIDGDVLVTAPDVAVPLTIHTRLLTLIVAGDAAVRITALSREPGEQAEVIRGQVTARKAYASRDNQPDTLAAGEMVMVNQSIDLMEKERDTPAATAQWAEELARAAGEPQPWPVQK